MNKDFDNLQVGDTVAISDGDKRMLTIVVKLTKQYITTSQAIARAELVFSRKTGWMKGGDMWHPVSLFVPTKQEIEEITQEQNQRRLRVAAAFALQQTKAKIQQLSKDELQSVINALEPYYKKPEKI
jgi:rRNA maturation endonuclease Nob1